MSKNSDNPLRDSTLNLSMGCNGCEIWKMGNWRCYAGKMTAQYGGNTGYPQRFDNPVIFPDRMEDAESWSDLTGTERPDKPWLNGRPRQVLLNDMGDTFTQKLPVDWLSDYLPRISSTPHFYFLSTKRPSRMNQVFSANWSVPHNLMLGVSVTNRNSVKRVGELLKLKEKHPHIMTWVSVLPMYEPVNLSIFIPGIDWLVVGGEMGEGAAEFDARAATGLVDEFLARQKPVFVLQLGDNAVWDGQRLDAGEGGADYSLFPEPLRIREMQPAPKVQTHQDFLF